MLSQKQGKQLNRAECKFHTAPSLIPREGYPPTAIHPKSPGSHLDAREVVAVVDVLKQPKKTTSSSRWDTREVVVVVAGWNAQKNHLQFAFGREGGGGRGVDGTTEKNHLRLAFGCEGGGGGSRRVETTEKSHLRLAFGREGGGGEVVAGWYVWSSSHSNRPPWAGFSRVGPPLVIVVIAAVGCRHCCGSSLLRCDYASSLWCCWRFSSALRSLRRCRM